VSTWMAREDYAALCVVMLCLEVAEGWGGWECGYGGCMDVGMTLFVVVRRYSARAEMWVTWRRLWWIMVRL
jgi:hypothetical protein